jgi:hypothetical protein
MGKIIEETRTNVIKDKIFRAAQFDAEAGRCITKEAAAAFRKTAARLRKEVRDAQEPRSA